MKKIYVDMDGVLTDFDKQIADLLKKPLKRNWDFGSESWIWKKIDKAGKDFWAKMPWMPSGKKLWNALKKYNPTILTAPSRHSSSKTGKRLWLKEHLPDVPFIIELKKYKYADRDSVLIDDREKNIKKWKKAGGIAIHYKNLTNTLKKLDKIMSEDKESKKRKKEGKFIKINPYDAIVQEAVRELGSQLVNVDIIQLENSCMGNRIAWVSNKDLLEGKPGKEKIIHLCLNKIKDQIGRRYNPANISDNKEIKEIIKKFLVNVILPHENVHIEQELAHGGEFGSIPEQQAEKAENWNIMKEYGIEKLSYDLVYKIDKIADKIELLGLVKEAYLLDIIANTIQKEANLTNYFKNIITYIASNPRTIDDIVRRIRHGIEKWPIYNYNEKKGVVKSLKEALISLGKEYSIKDLLDPDEYKYVNMNTEQLIYEIAEWLLKKFGNYILTP
jgi:hypothetical protein